MSETKTPYQINMQKALRSEPPNELTQEELRQAEIEAWRVVYRNAISLYRLSLRELAVRGVVYPQAEIAEVLTGITKS